jgi:hypothetical protein
MGCALGKCALTYLKKLVQNLCALNNLLIIEILTHSNMRINVYAPLIVIEILDEIYVRAQNWSSVE